MIPFDTPRLNEILYIKSDMNYTIFHLNTGKKIVSSFRVKKYVSEDRFREFILVKSSHTYLINSQHIKDITIEDKIVKLTFGDNHYIILPKRKFKEIASYIKYN